MREVTSIDADFIIHNKKLVVVNTDYEDDFYYVSIPSMQLSHIADEIYDKRLADAKESGLHSEEELLKLAKANNLYTDEDDKKIAELSKKVEGLDLLLSKLKDGSDTAVKYRAIYTSRREEALKELNLYTSKRNSFLTNSAEHHAYTSKMQFLLPFSAFDIDGEQVWKKYKEFEREKTGPEGSARVLALYTTFIEFNNSINAINIRKLSRDGTWRTKWKLGCKTGTPLIAKPIAEWTYYQIALCFWSNFYDNIYESYDSPPDWVIESDEELDKWLDERHKKNEQEKIQKFGRAGVNKDHDDIIIIQDKDLHFKEFADKRDIRRFNSLNEEMGISLSKDIITGELKENG